MKLKKLWTICAVAIFVMMIPAGVYAQTTGTENVKEQSVADVSLISKKKGIATYSFSIEKEFQESNVRQHTGRLEQITGSRITCEYADGKIQFTVESDKVKGYDLDNLIRGLVVLHGFSGYKMVK